MDTQSYSQMIGLHVVKTSFLSNLTHQVNVIKIKIPWSSDGHQQMNSKVYINQEKAYKNQQFLNKNHKGEGLTLSGLKIIKLL